MLSFSIDDLEGLRVKLLSAVLLGCLEGEAADDALKCATCLERVSAHLHFEGTTCMRPDPAELAHALSRAIQASKPSP